MSNRSLVVICILLIFVGPGFAQPSSKPSSEPLSQPASVSVEDVELLPASLEAASLPSTEPASVPASNAASLPASAPTAEEGELLARELGGKNWTVMAGLVLMALLAVANRFGLRDKIGKENLPLFGAALAIVGAMADSLLNAKGVPLLDAALAGLAAGASATGFWELLRKMMVQKATEAVVASEKTEGKDGKVSMDAAVVEAVVSAAVEGTKKAVEKKASKPRAKKASLSDTEK